ncbi:hypothetical protein DFJ73DRAFT_841208 [Zopfochytrium polystomum]|nr:hypothetical protein DFJ73DRAFT_841208 [Zopfochytrium polystomum]
MWALYTSYHDRYRENLAREDRSWVYRNEQPVAESGQRNRFRDSCRRANSRRSSLASENERTSSPGTQTPTSLSSEASHRRSQASSSEESAPHSETYNAVRDLHTRLWKASKENAERLAMQSSRAAELQRLYDESVDLVFRESLASHHEPHPDLGEEIALRMGRNNVVFPHPRSSFTAGSALRDLCKRDFTLEGFVPFITAKEQMMLLKVKEKLLLLQRWRAMWSHVRPPRPGWHELRTKEFHCEARRNRELLESPELQRLSHQARLAIQDLWRTAVTDRLLFPDAISTGLVEWPRTGKVECAQHPKACRGGGGCNGCCSCCCSDEGEEDAESCEGGATCAAEQHRDAAMREELVASRGWLMRRGWNELCRDPSLLASSVAAGSWNGGVPSSAGSKALVPWTTGLHHWE